MSKRSLALLFTLAFVACGGGGSGGGGTSGPVPPVSGPPNGTNPGPVPTPTTGPIGVPTAVPTGVPSAVPTIVPTALPTITPTSRPGPTPSPANCTTVASVSGYYPCDIQAAYNFPSYSAGTSQTVAVIDAFNDPTAESDLATYRATFGLSACTTANGCFRKVDQNGGANYPATDNSWAGEISLDVDMVSAVCPNCRILVVEANSAFSNDLDTGVNTAVSLGANVVSMSYGGDEYASEAAQEDGIFNRLGVAFVASTGDTGYNAKGRYPAASPFVTAVGGTSLLAGLAGTWVETAWTGSGSFCSVYEPKPSWQTDSGCTHRMAADISAVADPNTGVTVYQTTGGSGWMVYGGTSASAPIIGAAYALAGNSGSISNSSYPYAHLSGIRDIVAGTNGVCTTLYYCTALPGYDGPTGLGVPSGISALSSTRQVMALRSTRLIHSGPSRHLCGAPAPRQVSCDALVRTDIGQLYL